MEIKFTEGALQKYLKPQTFLETASFANLIVAELASSKLKRLKADLKAKAEYLEKTSFLSDSKTSCEVMAEQCGDLYIAICFAEVSFERGKPPRSKRELDKRRDIKRNFKGIKDSESLERAIDRTKKVLNKKVIGPRDIRSAKEKMAENSRLLPRHGHNEYFTPPPIIEAAREAMGGIDLDPASNEHAQKWIKAKRWIGEHEDGLKQSWQGKVWMNPPYNSGLLMPFVTRLLKEPISQAVTLLNNNTETLWSQALLKASNAVCFPKARLKFWNSEGENKTGAIQGSMICGLKVNQSRFLKAFEPIGVCSKWEA